MTLVSIIKDKNQKLNLRIKPVITILFTLFLSVINAQIVIDIDHSSIDTLKLEMHKFISIPDLRYSDRLKCITEIDLIPIYYKNESSYKWNIKSSKVYFWNTRFDSTELKFNLIKFFDGLSLEFKLTKNGQLIYLTNFNSLKDSLYTRAQNYYAQDSINTNNDNSNIYQNIDTELFDYYFKSAFNEEVFLDIHFPEVLLYFQLNNKSFRLYESNNEKVETTFRKLEIFEIEMTKNTMLVFDDNIKSEIEIQLELTNNGCEKIHKQLLKRINNFSELNIDTIENFECQRSRITHNFKYNKRHKIIESAYEKKTLTINDEPYYFWTEIKMK